MEACARAACGVTSYSVQVGGAHAIKLGGGGQQDDVTQLLPPLWQRIHHPLDQRARHTCVLKSARTSRHKGAPGAAQLPFGDLDK